MTKKLICTKTNDCDAWEFTVGKEYHLNFESGYHGDADYSWIVSDNGIKMHLFTYDGVICCAGNTSYQFKEKK